MIRLDERDRIAGMNSLELSRTDLGADDVAGRNFFVEVAPCTNVRRLAGWLAEQRRKGVSGSKKLTFVFDLPRAKELVRIAISYDSETRGATLLVETISSESKT